MPEDKDLKTDFIQCAHFGLTIGYRILNGFLDIAFGFAHKKSPKTSISFEHFCREQGRRVVENKLKGFNSGLTSGAPYTFTAKTDLVGIEGKKVARTAIYTALDNLTKKFPGEEMYGCFDQNDNQVWRTPYMANFPEQIDNNELVSSVLDSLQTPLERV